VTQAVIWGNPDKGAHTTFTKFTAGYDAGMHTHTNDVWIVGVKGAYLYKDDGGENRVGPGEFLRVPGGHKHRSGGDKNEGALFYEEGSGKFDLILAK
jgi:mannose-6-phosphate isomerase-like protein (cupin superfamily)